MLSISNIKSSAAAVHYYEHDDYYAKETNEHKELSEWYGKGAEKLKLEGKVEKEDFKQVLEGELPNGVELGRVEDGKRIHAPGMDLTFSAPKSVSILAEFYVSLSRAKYEVSLITDDKKKLIETLKRQTGERVAATEHQAIKYTELGMQERQNIPNLEVKLGNIYYNRQANAQDIQPPNRGGIAL